MCIIGAFRLNGQILNQLGGISRSKPKVKKNHPKIRCYYDRKINKHFKTLFIQHNIWFKMADSNSLSHF